MRNPILNLIDGNGNFKANICSKLVALLGCFIVSMSLLAVQVMAEHSGSAKPTRKISIKLPQTYKDALTTRTFGPGNLDGAVYGYGCDRGEVVLTCDANTSLNMPKGSVWRSGKLVLGPASNTALFGIKRKTMCKAMVVADNGGRSGCAYESCLGFKKSVLMVCVPKGSKS
jgi:hypothetical protein